MSPFCFTDDLLPRRRKSPGANTPGDQFQRVYSDALSLYVYTFVPVQV